MVNEAAVQELMVRVSRLEERDERRSAKTPRSRERVQRPSLTRAVFLRKAGALAAGVAGAALLETGVARDAYATTSDTNFVATGISGGGGTGFNAPASGHFQQGAQVVGSSTGLLASGIGTGAIGIQAYGGTNATGILSYGSGTGIGVAGIGGSSNGAGLAGSGSGTSGHGVEAQGSGSGAGIFSLGGATHAPGIVALASGRITPSQSPASVGVYGEGEAVTTAGSGGEGVHGVGGSGGAAGVGGAGVVATGGQPYGAPIRLDLQPSFALGPPAGGTHNAGEIWADSAAVLWVCTTIGAPGKWVPLQVGGLNTALFTAVSTQQYSLVNSDGATWTDMDATNLKLTITPTYKCQAVISANADLWTSVAGFNQDMGIFISGGSYGAGQIVAWKESGGFAGTFSPNAASVETVAPLIAGTAYNITIRWKSNRPGNSSIWAGAGTSPNFSPTRLTALLVVSQ